MVYARVLPLAAALLYSVVRGEPSLASFQWARQRSRSSHRPGKPTPASGTTATPRRRIPPAREVPSAAANATRVLLPLVPLLADLPVLTAHARAAWPWMRARLAATAATAAAFSRRPLAFGTPLTPRRPRRHQGQHAATRRNRVCGYSCGSHRWHQENNAVFRIPVTVGATIGGVSCSCALGGGSDNGGLFSEDQSPRHPIGGGTIPSPPPIPSTLSPHNIQNNDGALPVTRFGAIKGTLVSATRWVAGAAVAGSALAGSGPTAVFADGMGSKREAQKGGGGEDGERFGSKAFTKKSYDGFADGYDDLDGGWAASAIGTEELRAQLLASATGRVLEVGVGTGLNLRHYRRDSVSAIDAVDLSPGMLRQASSRVESLGMKGLVKLSAMDVEHLEFPPKMFDTVVDTFSLCVFSDPSAALREMGRVCKPGGRVLLLENSKSEFGPLAAYQDLTASYLADKGGAKGCFWNQDVEALCRGAGLTVVRSSPALPGGLFRTLECVPARET